MTQQELNQQVARHTGESLREVSRRGFTMLDPAYELSDDSVFSLPHGRRSRRSAPDADSDDSDDTT